MSEHKELMELLRQGKESYDRRKNEAMREFDLVERASQKETKQEIIDNLTEKFRALLEDL